MYLSRLRIFGFKSFAQKVEVHFPPDGITAVVGPNGCGKSNITEAIRWVLGETRAKQLRSSKMEDVIFSGTADRPQMNFAEVSLLINNDRGVLPSEYTEIQITRRVSRDGQSAYYLNGQECRLKDIHHLFMDTGMGAASYSLMHDGMIRELLSDDPQVRRQLFEETAGITKYKQQRKETLRQLEKTAVELQRVDDHLRVVRQSLSGYERQVKKAEEWKRIKTRLRELELSVSADQYDDLSSALAEMQSSRTGAEHRNSELTARLAELEARLEERKLLILEDEQAYRETEQMVANRQLELKEQSGEIRALREKSTLWQMSIQRLESDLERADEQIHNLQDEKSKAQDALVNFDQGERDDSELEALMEARGEARQNFDEKRQALREAENQRLKDMQRVTNLRTQVQALQSKIEHLETQGEMGAGELETLEVEIKSSVSKIVELEAELGLAEEALFALSSKRDGLEDQKMRLEAELSGLRSVLRGIESQEMQKRTRLQLLEQMEKSGEGLDGGAQFLLQGHADQLLGALSQKITFPDQHATALAFCLGESASALLVQDSSKAELLGRTLSEKKKGRALMAQLGGPLPVVASPDFKGRSGVHFVPDLIQAQGEVLQLSRWLLSRFVLVDSEELAQELVQEFSGSDLWFVSPSGSARHACGLWRIGSAGHENSWVERKAEIQKLEDELRALTTQRDTQHQREEDCQNRLQEVLDQLESLRGEEHFQREIIQAPSRELAGLRAQQTMLDRRLDQLQRTKEQVASDLGPARELCAEYEAELESLQSELYELEVSCDRLSEEVRMAESRKNDAEESYTQASNDLFASRNSKDRLEQQLSFVQRRLSEIQSDAARWREELQDLRIQNEEAEAELENLESRFDRDSEILLSEEERRDEARMIFEEKNALLEDLRIEIKDLNTESRQLVDLLHKGELRLEKLRTDLAALCNRVFERYEIDLATTQVEKVDYDPQAAGVEIRELMVQLEKLGPVNHAAFEDYEIEKKRVEDVEKQFDDLDRARISLQRTITRLDEVARERFLATFGQIRQNFQDVFSSLMIDGETKLELEGDDPLEALIHINARPTGKKMRGVQLLSGGERALTATALLFAMYMVKPSPYCILDEVDGPLDDANIGRFVQLLRRFSRQTQFIVVTHNKRTMAASDRLYGVTQEIKGISRIASVQLEEAASLVIP